MSADAPREPTRLEAEGYSRLRMVAVPAAKAILELDPIALDEAIAFAERGVARVEALDRVQRADVERSRNELELMRWARHARKDLEKIAQGQEARDRITRGG